MNFINFAKELGLALSGLVIALLFITGSALAQEPVKEEITPPKIVIFGDSLVAGYQLPPGDSFPEKLQKKLEQKGYKTNIIGAGLSGDTTSGGLARLEWSIPADSNAVLLELGANDALRGLPPEVTRKNLDDMISRLLARDIKVLLAGMRAPPNMGKDYEGQFNKIYPTLAEKFDIPLYPFFLDGVAANPEYLLQDGMHPNTAGVDLIVEKICPMVEQLLNDMRPTP